MRRISWVCLFCIGLMPAGFLGQILKWEKPDPSKQSFATTMKQAVVNVEETCKQNDGSSFTENGTAFFAAYEDPRLPQGQYFIYLVTNRHIAECWGEDNIPHHVLHQQFHAIAVDGSAISVNLDPAKWSLPSDDSVDLAATPFAQPGNLKISAIPLSLFATKNFMHEHVIVEGNAVVFAGYFYQIAGTKKFQPIVRQGILSMIPDEPLPTATGKMGWIYLCDAHVFGGNSGSPVFVASDAINFVGYHLLGVVSGYYFEDENFNLEIAATIKGSAKANSGIAIVVPSDSVIALLDEAALKEPRDKYLAQLSPIENLKSPKK